MSELKASAARLKADYEQIESKIVDCYFGIIVRLLTREKTDKARNLLTNVFATIEKIEPSEKSVTHGLMLKHCLCYLKIIRSEIRKNQAETRVNQTIVNSLIKTGFEAACDGFRVLIKKKDQVEFFMTELESLAYFCYFATAAGKISQTCQFATVVKSLVETFIKKIDSEDRHNILVEVMIFSKKYLIPKAQRFNLYQLLITTLVLYASALSQTDQKTKAILYVDKVLSLLHTIEPDSQLVGTLLSLMTIYRERSLKEASAVQAEDYYVKVTVQDPEISKADPISDGSYDGDDKEESEARAQRKKKKLFKEKKVKMEPLSSGLFIRGFADHQVSEQTFMKFSQKWVSKRKSEKEKSLNKTLNKEFKIISINESAQKKIAASRPSIGKPKDYSETEKRSKSSQKQTQGQQIFLRNSAFTLKDVHSRSELRDSLVPTQGKSFIRPGTATFGARRSGIGSSLVVSRKNSIDQADRLSTFNQLQLKRQNLGASGQEGKGSVFFIDNFQAGNHQEIESSSDEEQKPKPKSMAKKLQNLLYKAELREQMPDKYRFLKNKPKAKAMSRQSKWNHQRYTSMETDGSTAFTASKDWLYDRMLASRPRLDEDRALTHNKTMNIKNHQVMIEFKTGDHVELQMAKKKKNLDYKQKTFLVNCSYTGDTVSNHLSKGVPLGYCDHQFEARKHSYIEKLELKSAMVSRRSSAKHSVQEGNLHSQAHSNARLNLHSSHKGSSRDLAQGNHKASNNPSIDNLNTLKPSNHRNQTSAPAVSKFIKKVDRVSDYHSKSGKVDEDIKESHKYSISQSNEAEMSQIKSMTPKGELSKDSKGRMKTAIRKVINLTRTRAQKGDSALSQPMLELLHKSHNLAFLRNTLPIQNPKNKNSRQNSENSQREYSDSAKQSFSIGEVDKQSESAAYRDERLFRKKKDQYHTDGEMGGKTPISYMESPFNNLHRNRDQHLGMNYGTKGGGMPSRIFEEPSAKYNETLQMLPIARDTVYNVASKPSLKRIEYGTNSWFCSLQMLHRKFAFQKHRSMSVLKRYMPSKFRGPLSMKSIKFRNSAQYNLGGLPKRRCSLPANLNKSIVMEKISESKHIQENAHLLSRTEVSTRAFVELDNGKISFVDFKIKLAIKDNKDLCLKISYITSDFTKKFYLTLNDDLVRSWKSMTHSMPDKLEYQLSLRYMYNRVLDDYLPRSAEALYTIIQYKNGGPRIDSVVCTLLNHFIDRKARVKQLNGRTFVNLKGLTEGQIILHSLFKLLREYYFQLPELVCKQVITHNNFTVESSMASGFHGRRGRHNTQHKGQAIPIAYNFINDDGPSNNPGTYLSLQSVESRRIGYEKSILSYNMSETAYNPSAVLCSHLYRLEHNQIVEMGSLLLSSSAMMDINFNFATYVCRVKSSYFLVFLTISPPESFELWRQKDSKPNDMALSGTWIDKIGLRVQIYNCSQFKVTNVPFEMTFKEVVSHSHVSELERIYRALICGGMDLQTHSEIRDFTVRNLIVQENSLIWLDRKDSVKGSQASSVVLSDSKHEPPVLNSIPYNKLDPYKHLCERRGSRYDKPQMYSLSRKQKLDLLDDDIKLENSSLMPWGTRYKRMQLLPGLNKVFYTLVDMGTYRIKMVFFYSGEDNHERIRIKSFNTETDEVYNLTVTDPIKVTRIVHLIMKQKENDSIYLCQQFIKVSMNFFLNIDKRLSGRHYQVNDVYRDRVSIARQETVEQTKWNVVCMTETVYLRNFFLSKSLYFPTIHPLLGKLYIECRLYFSFKLSKNQAIALLIISPMRKRMTSYHLVINAVDLENYFDCNIFPLVHNNQELIKIFSKVISKLVLVKRKTYSIPALPLQLIKRRTSLSYTEVLKNVFDQRDLLKAEKDQEKTYLRKTIYHSEVIVKAVVKFNNQYWILTVVKNLLLDRIDIEAYVPSVKRKFQCRMTTHDYEYMTSNAETELSKRAPKLLQKLSDLATNYQQFEVMLRQDIDQDTIEMGLVSPQMISSKAIKKMKFSHSKSFGTLSGYESVKQLFQKNFQATKFWFDVLKKSKLILKHNDLLIEFETFRAVLKENIWQSLCFTGNLKYEITVDLDTERHFVATSKTVEVFNPIYIDKLDQYSFLLKVIFLREDQQHHVDKVNLDQLFKIYGLLLQEKLAKSRQLIEGKPIDNISKSEKNHTQVEKSHISEIESSSMQAEPLVTNTLPPISRLRLSDIRDLTRILELNVNDSINERYMSVIDSKLTYFNDEKVLSKQIIYQDKYERRMKLNSKLCLDIMTDPHYKQYNDVLISRHVFTVRPQQLLVILYNKRCKLGVILVAQFFFTVYNNIHCKVNETAMTVNEVKVHVPHVLVLIENKEFTEVGNRLYSVYKNTLLAYASLKSAKIGD